MKTDPPVAVGHGIGHSCAEGAITRASLYSFLFLFFLLVVPIASPSIEITERIDITMFPCFPFPFDSLSHDLHLFHDIDNHVTRRKKK